MKEKEAIKILESLGYTVMAPHNKQDLQERKEKFRQKLEPYKKKYGATMIENFFNYWSQVNENGKKMHFEKQKTFQISNRLATWKSKDITRTERKLHDDGTIYHRDRMNYEKKQW